MKPTKTVLNFSAAHSMGFTAFMSYDTFRVTSGSLSEQGF